MTIPLWRAEAIGIWSPEDEQDERTVIGLALQGVVIPRIVQPRHFYRRWHQQIFCAALICGAWSGRATLPTVALQLRAARLLWPGAAVELGEMYSNAQFVALPDWADFVASAKARLRVMALETQLHQAIWSLPANQFLLGPPQ